MWSIMKDLRLQGDHGGCIDSIEVEWLRCFRKVVCSRETSGELGGWSMVGREVSRDGKGRMGKVLT